MGGCGKVPRDLELDALDDTWKREARDVCVCIISRYIELNKMQEHEEPASVCSDGCEGARALIGGRGA